ncbi:MAG: small basic family protein [Ezakiella sp.]|nr:small basic family protein [Ezakiella sp.]MDD7761779.1 small basic family protein [Bacillota bacterium]MDY3946594.1 small basic family protein [Ezakiella sp.]
MLIVIVGLIVGLLIGLILPYTYNTVYSLYISVIILASLDSVFGGLNANLQKKFDPKIFISGFIGNTVIAVILTLFGERVGVPMYYATIVVFGSRIFNNFAEIRRILIKK